MAPRIIVCTTDDASWSALRRAMGRGRLDRVDRIEDAVKHGATQAVAAAVVDDRFLSVLPEVERALRRFSPLFHDTVVMTVGEALTAHWIGLLEQDLPNPPLLAWMAHDRTARRPSLAWQ